MLIVPTYKRDMSFHLFVSVYKTLIKEIKQTQTNGKTYHAYMLEQLTLFPVYSSSIPLVKFLPAYFIILRL